MTSNRRGFLLGLGASLVAAPAVIRIPNLLMPIKPTRMITKAVWVKFNTYNEFTRAAISKHISNTNIYGYSELFIELNTSNEITMTSIPHTEWIHL